MPNRTKQLTTAPTTYRSLVAKVSKELDDLEFLIKRSTAEAYWNVGKYIDDHLLAHQDRAEYGKTLLENLGKDVGRDPATLRRAVQFYRAYPILAERRELNWNHYKSLITVTDGNERKKLEQEIIEKNWKADKLQKYLSTKRKLTSPVDVSPLKFTPGKFHTYRVVKANSCLTAGRLPLIDQGSLALDLGFRMQTLAPPEVKGSEGDLVELLFKDGQLTGAKKAAASGDELFTYLAEVERVIDGDTILASFDLGLPVSISQKLRLAGVDCPELDTAEGKAAKRFVESMVKDCSPIIVKTVKDRTDRFDRYLAEIFLGPDPRRENFLNQMLLDERLAVRYG